MKTQRLSTALLLCAAALAAGCSKNTGGETVAVTGVTLDKTTVTLQKGGTQALVATVLPDDATDKTVTWSSDKPDVASVDASNGMVTAVDYGTAVVTVTSTDGAKTATCTVTINEPVVYAGGYCSANSISRPYIWKNGEYTKLSTPNESGAVQAIAVADGKLYAGGYYRDAGNTVGVYYPCAWIDGERTDYAIKEGSNYNVTSGMTVADGKVYMCGYYNYNSVAGACLWVDGVQTDLNGPDGTRVESRALAICIDNGKVYVAGYCKVNGVTRVCLWTDGVCECLTSESSVFSGGLTVSDGKVYVTGHLANYTCFVWVDGSRIDLEQSYERGITRSIKVKDGKTYVGGYYSLEEAPSSYMPCVWNDGKFSSLSSSKGAVYALCFMDDKLYMAGNININSSATAALWIDSKIVEGYFDIPTEEQLSYISSIAIDR